MKIRKFNESFSSQSENIRSLLLTNNKSNIKLALYLLKSNPEYIEEVSKAILDEFTIERKYQTLEELIENSYSSDFMTSNFIEIGEIFKNIKLCNLDKYVNFIMSLQIDVTFTEYQKSINLLAFVSFNEVKSVYIDKNYKLNLDSTKEEILEEIYNLIDKHWNPVIKGKKTLIKLINEITNDVNELPNLDYTQEDEDVYDEDYDDEDYDDEDEDF
jgi:hypothetical protein